VCWKLNLCKSLFAGTTTILEELPSGEMQLTTEGFLAAPPDAVTAAQNDGVP
jgi:hypothetical protein